MVVPVASVVVTGGVALWSKIIDARSKREDRQHARSLDYEGRVWQAKNDVLRRLISACRAVKRRALTAQRHAQVSKEDEEYSRARLAQGLGEFPRDIGDEEGISEITAYAAEPVREALDEMLMMIEERLRSHQVSLFMLRNAETQLELARLAQQEARRSGEEPEEGIEGRLKQRRANAMARLTAADIDVDAVIKLCDHIIDVARKDIQGRY
ncbi:hypothetical protein [Mycobacterium sp. UM_CSW]|uniref:hypothetical protein n=1 Tax=Mycobacterium sp. UM_CSW TaxID=1370119 RepID=UPI0004137C8E|nr:hypothetical protein [Mycobacterium sp. UM_CSW]